MSAFIVYAVIAAVVGVCVGAWQRAVLDGPAYEEERTHRATCRICEPPGWFWTTGYSCRQLGGEGRYPFHLSPWWALLASAFWPGASVRVVLGIAQRQLARRIAAKVEADYYAKRDLAEVERLLGEVR